MNKIAAFANIVLMTSYLTACSEETHTVEWYKEHPEVRKKEVEKCKLKPLAELMADKHCTVIQQAEKEAFDDQQINAPLPNIKFK